MTKRNETGWKNGVDRGRLEPNDGSSSNKIYLLGQRDLFSCVFRNWQFKKIYSYVGTDYHISIYDNILKVAYIFNGVERTNRGKEGRSSSREWFFCTPFPLIFAHSLASLLVVSVVARPPSYSRRRRDAETDRQISRKFPKRTSIFHPGLRYSAALIISRAPLWSIIEN